MALSIFELYAGSDMIDSWTEGERCHSYPCAGEKIDSGVVKKIFDEHMLMCAEDEQLYGESDPTCYQIIETPFIIDVDGSTIRYDDESSVLIQSTTAQWAKLRSAA